MTNESSASLWGYGLYGGWWCDQEEKIIFQFWILLLTLDISRCLSVPQHGPFFLHISTRSCLSRSSFWKSWFSGSGRSSSRAFLLLNLCLLSHRCAPLNSSYFIQLNETSVKWSGWEYMGEDIFLNPDDFKTDFRSWPHRQLHWTGWRCNIPNVAWDRREEGDRNILSLIKARAVPWWDCTLAVCLLCSYCKPVRGIMQSVLHTDPCQPWCWYPHLILGGGGLEGWSDASKSTWQGVSTAKSKSQEPAVSTVPLLRSRS